MGWITPIAFLLCHTYSIGDAATLETFSSKFVLSPERGALTGHFRKYLETACPTLLDQVGEAGGFACHGILAERCALPFVLDNYSGCGQLIRPPRKSNI